MNSHRVGIRNVGDFSPFGVELDGRTFEGEFYRYSFNGKEKTDEISGKGNSYDFGARMYDPRVGRWMNRDPLEAKHAELNPYNFVSNMPIIAVDKDGKDYWIVFQYRNDNGDAVIKQVQYKNGKLYNEDGTKWNGKGLGKYYFNAVKKDIDKLKNDDPKVRKVVQFLEDSNSDHFISNHEDMRKDKDLQEDTDQYGIVGSNEPDDEGGSWTAYDPFRWEEELVKENGGSDTGTNDTKRQPRVTLGHELFHAFDSEDGGMTNGLLFMPDGSYLEFSEIAAVNFENLIRKVTGDPQRIKYSGITIPDQYIEKK